MKGLFETLSQDLTENVEEAPPIASYWKSALDTLFHNKLAMSALIVLSAIILGALLIPALSTHTYHETHLSQANLAPSTAHFFGTDELGRDLFVRAFWGARLSLFIGLAAACIDMVIGVIFGAYAGIKGGRTEQFMLQVMNTISIVPYLLIVLLLIMMMGQGVGTIILAMTLTGWLNMARIVRSRTLQIKQSDYVTASITFGASNWHILKTHIAPNAFGSILTTLTFTVPYAIFTETFLSFLGCGVPAPHASWGKMVIDALPAMTHFPWRFFFPAALLSLTMVAFNLLGDGVRDAFDKGGAK